MKRTVVTVLFGLLYPVASAFALYQARALGLRPLRADNLALSVLYHVAMGLLSIALAWLVIRPRTIHWVSPLGLRWPYLLVAAALAAKLIFWRPDNWPWMMAFYMLGVGLSEEFVYRVCVEDGLSQLGQWPAILLAGVFFGVVHGAAQFLAGTDLILAIRNNIGMGILGQVLFRFFYRKGGLALATSVHGLMDFFKVV